MSLRITREQAAATATLVEAVQRAKEAWEKLPPERQASMRASQVIGYVLAESMPEEREGERYCLVRLQYLEGVVVALRDGLLVDPVGNLLPFHTHLLALVPADRKSLLRRVRKLVDLYRVGLRRQQAESG